MGPIGGFRASSEKVLIQFISNHAGLLIGWVFTKDSIFGPVSHGGLKLDQVRGFWTLIEKVYIWFMPMCLLGECSEMCPFSDLWPNFWPPAVSQTIKSTKCSYESLMFVTGSRAIGEDCVITDAVYSQNEMNTFTLLTLSVCDKSTNVIPIITGHPYLYFYQFTLIDFSGSSVLSQHRLIVFEKIRYWYRLIGKADWDDNIRGIVGTLWSIVTFLPGVAK